MAEAMKGMTKAMVGMNKSMNLPQMQKIMMEFAKQSEMMDFKEEAMGDAIDDVMEDEDDEEEQNEMVSQIIAEVNMDLSSKLGAAQAGTKNLQPQNEQETKEEDEDDLQKRLDMLRKS